ncbi:hypothetical protein [Burkholderia sp. A9]|uniref:hypothetical protein n=1 Tax=Burkholderia sp. A9 TaxID=1365108 RepID=UPI000A55FF98|nr:hypothetical protein [Burkholderia sp. A9]
MEFHLTVIEPFGGDENGDEMTDPETVAEVLDGENQHHVVKRIAEYPNGQAGGDGAYAGRGGMGASWPFGGGGGGRASTVTISAQNGTAATGYGTGGGGRGSYGNSGAQAAGAGGTGYAEFEW